MPLSKRVDFCSSTFIIPIIRSLLWPLHFSVQFSCVPFSAAGDGDCPEERPVSRMKQIESTRALRRKRQEFSLEESWTSLDLFNRCQRGRISFDIQGLCLP